MSFATRKKGLCHQMMKGFQSRKKLDEYEDLFLNKYESLIDYINENLEYKMSVGAGGAIGKMFLWHEKERNKIMEFTEKLKTLQFNGENDPAHIYWLWSSYNQSKATALKFYKKCVKCLRNYINNSTITNQNIAPATEDVFTWDIDYKFMINPCKNQYGFYYRCKNAPTQKEIENILLTPYLAKAG